MITVSLDEKNAELIVNLLKSRIDIINGQIKQLEKDKKELEVLINNFNSRNIPVNIEKDQPIESGQKILTEEHGKEPGKESGMVQSEEPGKVQTATEESGHNEGFILIEIEFDHKSLPEITFGKNILRRSEDGQKIYLTRTGYSSNIKARLEDLIYLQEHPFEVENAIVNLSRNKKTSIKRILKEVDFNNLDMIFESCSPNQNKEKENQEENQEEIKEIKEIKAENTNNQTL